MRIPALFVLMGGLASVGASLRAQSLAEVAKQEEDRRKSVKVAAKAYTNKDLKETPAPLPTQADASAPSATPPDVQAAPATDAARPSAEPVPTVHDEAPAEIKDRAYWSKRMQSGRDQLDRDRTLAEALQSRINSLTADFANRDDPAQRAKLAADRDKALVELDRQKKAVDADQKALVALGEEARRAGTPAGWLR